MKSHVAMSLCFLCNEPKEVILHRFKPVLENGVYNRDPCDKCKNLMKQGIIFISVKDGETNKDNPYRTGKWIVLKEEAAREFVSDENLLNYILRARVAFVEDEVFERTGLNELLKGREEDV